MSDSDNPAPGTYRIISIHEGGSAPVGVHRTRPTFQNVRLNAPIQEWVVRVDDDGTYRLSVGRYPFTGVAENNVIASLNNDQDVGWKLTYYVAHGAYTIARADDALYGWTVQNNLSDGTNVSLKPVLVLPSYPPKIRSIQLFEFHPIDD